jgi:outer membrane protein
MKRTVVFMCLALFSVLSASIAMAADSISGRIGVNGQIGFLVPADSDAFEPYTPSYNLQTDVGFIGGGGLIYGVNKNLAIEFNITYTEFGGNIGGFQEGDFDTTNIGFGMQYRFVDIPVQHLVPYAGGGLDILFNGFSSSYGESLDVDTVAGAHLCGGVDYFILPQLALNAELKGVLAPDADIKFGGIKVGNFDPTSLSMTFGVRYFFN